MLARLSGWGVQRKAVKKEIPVYSGVIDVISMEEESRKEPILPKEGERVAQAVIAKDYILPLVKSQGDLTSENTGRGTNGFGSSGR